MKNKEYIDEEHSKLKKAMKPFIKILDEAIPAKIAEMRREKGLSQREMADIMGIYRQNWNKVESGPKNGGNRISIEQAIAFSLFFNVTMDALIKNEPQSTMESILREQLDAQKRINALLEKRIKELEK